MPQGTCLTRRVRVRSSALPSQQSGLIAVQPVPILFAFILTSLIPSESVDGPIVITILHVLKDWTHHRAPAVPGKHSHSLSNLGQDPLILTSLFHNSYTHGDPQPQTS